VYVCIQQGNQQDNQQYVAWHHVHKQHLQGTTCQQARASMQVELHKRAACKLLQQSSHTNLHLPAAPPIFS
jgi:hypothetical protein